MGRLEEVEIPIGLDDDCLLEDVDVTIGLTDAGVEIGRLVEKAEADCVIHVALSLEG